MAGDDESEPRGEGRDVVESGPPRPPGRWPWWSPFVVAVLVALGVVAALRHGGGRHAAPAPTPTPTPTRTAARAPAAGEAATVSPTPLRTVIDVGHPLLGVTAGWELFGRGPHDVVRIELARGRAVRTPVPPLLSSGPVSFVAGPRRVVVRPLDAVPGYVVKNGRPARRLRGALGHGGLAFPGPRGGEVWVQVGRGNHARLALVGIDGRKKGVTIRVPADGWPSPDGGGHALVSATDGVYEARPAGLRRVTTGRVVAVGRTGWLAVECDARHDCANVVIQRGSHARHALAGRAIGPQAPRGVISPDGSTAAVFRVDSAGNYSVHLLDLSSGAGRRVPVPVDQDSVGPETLAWSPDSRLLFVVTSHHKVVAVDARTGRVRHLRIALPPITQLAVRPARG